MVTRRRILSRQPNEDDQDDDDDEGERGDDESDEAADNGSEEDEEDDESESEASETSLPPQSLPSSSAHRPHPSASPVSDSSSGGGKFSKPKPPAGRGGGGGGVAEKGPPRLRRLGTMLEKNEWSERKKELEKQNAEARRLKGSYGRSGCDLRGTAS